MPKRKRFKLLLDEMLPKRRGLPQSNHYHDLKHIVHDFHAAGVTDEVVINMAVKEKRIIVTNNIKHFRRLGKKKRVSVIGIDQGMTLENIDKKLTSTLRNWNEKMGVQYIKLSR